MNRSGLPQGITGYSLVAIGALAALSAIQAVVASAWEQVFFWLGVGAGAELIGHLRLDIDDATPQPPSLMSLRVAIHDAGSASGIGQPMIAATFLTSVFVPVIDLLQAGFLDGWFATPMAILILWSALYRMAFVGWAHGAPSYVGFPAAWGVVAFYLHAFDATPGAAVLIVGIALVASLVPIPWPHPTQTLYWPAASRAVLLIWLLAAGSVLTHGFPASSLEKAVLLVGGLYACTLAAMARRIAV